MAKKQARLAAKKGRERYHLAEGYVKMMVPPAAFHYWGNRLGYECWDDKQFVHEFLRDNPECRVKSRSRAPRVGWGGSKKFHKNYGEW